MNHDLKIYWTGVEFNLKPTHDNFGELKGGFVYAFVKSNNQNEALNKFNKELGKQHLIPIEFEFIELYEDVNWANKSEQKHYELIITETTNCSDVILDDFYMYRKI